MNSDFNFNSVREFLDRLQKAAPADPAKPRSLPSSLESCCTFYGVTKQTWASWYRGETSLTMEQMFEFGQKAGFNIVGVNFYEYAG